MPLRVGWPTGFSAIISYRQRFGDGARSRVGRASPAKQTCHRPAKTLASWHETLPAAPLEQKDLFDLLKRAYIDAHYDYSYKITKSELEYLASRVRKLQSLRTGESITVILSIAKDLRVSWVRSFATLRMTANSDSY